MNNRITQSTFDTDEEPKTVDTYEVIDRCLIVHLNQELDHHYTLDIRDKADKIIDKRNVRNIIFDFTGVPFTDSSGIGVIMGRYKKVHFTGGKVAVTNVNATVDRIFRLSGIYKIVHLYESIDEALEDMRIM